MHCRCVFFLNESIFFLKLRVCEKIDVFYDESFNKALSIKKADGMFVLAMINLEVCTFKGLLLKY